MSKIDEYKAQMRIRKAAKLGMTLEQYDAHVEQQIQLASSTHRAIYDRAHGWAVIAANANFFKRAFIKLP